VESKKEKKNITKRKQSHRHREQTCLLGGGGRGDMAEIGEGE